MIGEPSALNPHIEGMSGVFYALNNDSETRRILSLYEEYKRMRRTLLKQGRQNEIIDFIEQVRKNNPIVPLCLHSSENLLDETPVVIDHWHIRFKHHFKLYHHQPNDKFGDEVREALLKLPIDLKKYR